MRKQTSRQRLPLSYKTGVQQHQNSEPGLFFSPILLSKNKYILLEDTAFFEIKHFMFFFNSSKYNTNNSEKMTVLQMMMMMMMMVVVEEEEAEFLIGSHDLKVHEYIRLLI